MAEETQTSPLVVSKQQEILENDPMQSVVMGLMILLIILVVVYLALLLGSAIRNMYKQPSDVP
jgi:cell shape-determining protein MreD